MFFAFHRFNKQGIYLKYTLITDLTPNLLLIMDHNANVFSNGALTVTYEPKCCANSGLCAKQLSNVFRNSVIPWINLEGAETHEIVKQVKRCPSGALKFFIHKKEVA